MKVVETSPATPSFFCFLKKSLSDSADKNKSIKLNMIYLISLMGDKMALFTEIPDWLGAAIIGAIFAAVGYLARELIERRKVNQAIVAENISNLKSLLRLLGIQKRVYDLQCEQRNELVSHLEEQFPEEVVKYAGFEEKFEYLYDKMNLRDREIHLVIRSYTKGSLLPLNKKIQEIAQNINVNLLKVNPEEKEKLKVLLEDLDLHLTLWLAKYEDWIPDNPKHSLVYLVDEKEHGVGFPKGIEDVISKTLEKK